jgi:L-ascorbate metabolism protein UlaG (beta-lactamase superfamily)
MLPISIGSYKTHGTFNFLIEARGKRIMFMGSTHIHFGGKHKDPLPKRPIDVLLLAIPAWDTGNADRQLQILNVLKPKVLIPHHYDDYFWDWREGCFVMEYANLPRFLREAPLLIKRYKLKTIIKQLDFGQSYRVR